MMNTHYDSAIIGFGSTGASCARYLAMQGERLLVVDSRQQPPALDALSEFNPEQVTASFGGFDATSISQAERLVFSPGVDRYQEPFSLPSLSNLPATGDIQLFANARRSLSGALVAITGTNGKSTVAHLTSLLLETTGAKVAVGGNFGPTALDLLSDEDVRYWVLELSSFQLDLVTSLGAEVALVLNVSEDHIDRHRSLANYTTCKQRVFTDASACIWSRNDVSTMPPQDYQGRQISVGTDMPSERDDFGVITTSNGRYLAHATGWRFPIDCLQLHGGHNELNVLFAVAAAYLAGGDLTDFATVLEGYQGLPHRCQLLLSVNGIRCIDDSKATNVNATCVALKAWSSQKNTLLLCGGKDEACDFTPLVQTAEGRVRHVACFGQTAAQLSAAFAKAPDINCIEARDLEDAFQALMAVAHAGDTLLLSPACSSQDQFQNFQARGLAFQSLVAAWFQGQGG